jgi:hypothetical protein
MIAVPPAMGLYSLKLISDTTTTHIEAFLEEIP